MNENNDLPGSPLDFATTEELLRELRSRFAAVLLITQKSAPNGESGDDTEINYSGGLNSAIGMAVRARRVLLQDAKMEREV